MWKVGIIGIGFWSEKHMKAWMRIPNVEIYALCDLSEERLAQRAFEFDVPDSRLFTNVDDLLHSGIDIIDIVTPPGTHLELVTKAAQAGIAVMCQKPFSPTYEDAEQMVKVADHAGIRLMVTENWRWLEPFQIIKRVLTDGILGKLYSAKYRHTDYFTPLFTPDREIDQPFLREMPKLIFFEMGVHWFDVWRFLFGEPQRLYAEILKVSPYVKGEDVGFVMLGHDDFCGMMDMSWATRINLKLPVGETLGNDIESMVIEGEKMTLIMSGNAIIKLIDNAGKETVLKEGPGLINDQAFEESHYRLQSHFVESLDQGTPFQTSGEDNLRTLKLTFSVYDSARNKKMIHL